MAINWVYKEKGGDWYATLIKPVIGRVTVEAEDGQADYYLNGKWYDYLGVEKAPIITYLPNSIEIDVGGNPAVVKEDSIANVQIDKLSTRDIVGLDVPLYHGWVSVNVDTPDLIVPFTTVEDSHNAMSGGIYTVPKTGRYKLDACLIHRHQHGSIIGQVSVGIFHNDTQVFDDYTAGSGATQPYCYTAPCLQLDLNKGDTVYLKVNTASTTDNLLYSGLSDTQRRSHLSIEFIGQELTS